MSKIRCVFWRHGFKGTKFYTCWCSMLQRCNDPHTIGWKRYGGRGITVCEEWRDFMTFWIDMWPQPAGLTLDRIDNDKGYDAINCRWATRQEQGLNRRKQQGTSSRFLGVSWHKGTSTWHAAIKLNGRTRHLGSFASEELAGAAAAAARVGSHNMTRR